MNLIFAIPAAAAAVVLLVNERPETTPKLDVPGALTATTGLFALVYGFSNAETHGWSAPLTVASARCERRPADCLRRDPGSQRAPAAPAPGGAGSRPWRVLRLDGDRRLRILWGVPVPDLLPAAHPGVQPDLNGPGLPADDGCGGGLGDAGQHQDPSPDRPSAAGPDRDALAGMRCWD